MQLLFLDKAMAFLHHPYSYIIIHYYFGTILCFYETQHKHQEGGDGQNEHLMGLVLKVVVWIKICFLDQKAKETV